MKKKKNLIRYLEASVFCAALSLIYQHFSHGIHSPWMSLLFLWPLLLGALPAALELAGLLPWANTKKDSRIGRKLYRFGIETLICASLLKGILEIAGTGSVYPDLLLALGGVLIAAGTLLFACSVLGFRHK